jgi:hypothetical protein
MMKTLLTAATLAAGLGMAGQAAAANSAAYCNQYATNYMKHYSSPVGSAAVGCGVGAVLGSLLSKGNGGAAVGGCVAGGATGLVLSDAKRRQLYDAAFNDCMYGSGGGSQQVYYGPGPAPTGYDGGYVVGSSDWMYACSLKYKSFQMNGPNAGQYKKQVNPTVWAWCNLPG